MDIYSIKDGEALVGAARNSIELFLKNPHFEKETVKRSVSKLSKSHGLYVTLMHYPTRTLRGHIGFPKPVNTVGEMVVDAAISAAFEDPKFVPVSHKELEHLIVEVTLLSDRIPLKGAVSTRLKDIKLGRDGLAAEYGVRGAILLPGTAVDEKWSKQRFLEEICLKVGLSKGHWSQPNVKIYRFEAQTFSEIEPGGRIVELHKD